MLPAPPAHLRPAATFGLKALAVAAAGLALALALALSAGRPALATPPAPPAAPPAAAPSAAAPPKPENLPAPVRLFARVESVRRQVPVLPVVVVVPSSAAYAAAIEQWRPAARFPVLIDDDSWRARENIARFVRAFKPARVVRWNADKEYVLAGGKGRPGAIMDVAARAWGAPDARGLRETWAALQFEPLGVVAFNDKDPAWTAALALAAARGQVLAHVDAASDPAGTFSFAQAAELSRQIEEAAAGSGYAFEKLGDALDAVTLCLHTPIKVAAKDDEIPPAPPAPFARDIKPGQPLAVTDLIGRRRAGARFEPDRWAWAGQIMGSEPAAAYNAMCAIFLQPTTAAVFDGYDKGEPWSQYDGGRAAEELRRIGLSVWFNGAGRSTEDWRRMAAGAHAKGVLKEAGGAAPRAEGPIGGVDAGLLLINSSGSPEAFNLQGGQGFVGDIPVLEAPAWVYMVHSFSAAGPGNRWTIAGRFLERGAYAYVGSSFEPYLQAFVPTPGVAKLMRATPLGAAVRFDNLAAWRINVMGDPLITLGPAAPRKEAPLPLEGPALDEEEALRAALGAGDFKRAIVALNVLGRDRDSTRLAAALLKDRPADLTPRAAYIAAMGAFRAGDTDTFIALWRKFKPEIAPGETDLADALWHALQARRGDLSEAEIDLLAGTIRFEQGVAGSQDALEVTSLMLRHRGAAAAKAFLQAQRDAAKDPRFREATAEALRKLK